MKLYVFSVCIEKYISVCMYDLLQKTRHFAYPSIIIFCGKYLPPCLQNCLVLLYCLDPADFLS